MTERKYEEVFEELLDSIKKGTITVFCGAGISYAHPSNLPIGNALKQNSLDHLLDFESGRDYKDILFTPENWEKIQSYQFEYYMSTLNNNLLIVDHIAEIFRSGKPNITHFFIANLVFDKFVRDIITTNFDSKIEDAYIVLSQDKIHLQSIFREADFTLASLLGEEPKIIKIHGCCTDPESLRTTLEAVVQKKLANARSPIIKNIFGESNKDILVLGYSFSDEFDVNNVIRTLENIMPKRIFHIKHNREDNTRTIEKLDPLFIKYDGYKIKVNTQTLIEALSERLGFNYNHHIKRAEDVDWENILSDWIDSSPSGLRLFITGSILYDIQSWNDAITLYEASRTEYLADDDRRGIGLALGQIAIIKKLQGNYPDSLDLFEKIIDLYEEIDEPILKARAMHNKAMIHQINRSFEKALPIYEEILSICENKSPFDFSNALGEIAAIYIELNDLDGALKLLKDTLNFNQEIGHIIGVATNLQDIGIIYQKQKKYAESQESLEKSKEIHERLGNIRSIGSILQNLGILEQETDLDKALNLFNTALDYQISVQDKPGIAQTLYQIGIIYLKKDDYRKAKEKFEESMSICEEQKNNLGRAYVLTQFAHLKFIERDIESAIKLVKEASEIFKANRDRDGYETSMKMLAMFSLL